MAQQSSQRVLISMMLLALLWIGVYWMWGPREVVPSVSFDRVLEPSEALREPLGGVAASFPIPELPPRGARTEQGTAGPLREPTLRVQPPQFRDHTVQNSETLESIALREYGDRRFWTAIAQANPLKDVERLRTGDVIRVPLDPQNVQGIVVDAAGQRSDPPPPAAPEYVEYLVKAGDSLSRISQNYYGSARYTDLIFQANRDQLDSPDDLREGDTLRLPASPDPVP